MNYLTSDQILSTVVGLLSSLTPPKYIITKPTSVTATEYIIINSLPINADVMQKCYFNVNYHVKDLAEGIPDEAKLAAGSQAVLAILKKATGTNYLIDFESQELFSEDNLKEHFSNLRFSYKNINS
jgi:hypothetical protein